MNKLSMLIAIYVRVKLYTINFSNSVLAKLYKLFISFSCIFIVSFWKFVQNIMYARYYDTLRDAREFNR